MPHLPREHSHSPAAYPKLPSRVLLSLIAATGLLTGQSGEQHHVTAVRFWSLGDVTRVAIETDGDFEVRSDHLTNPDRIFFDLTGTKPALGSKTLTVIPVSDKLVEQIRVAESQHNITRVVLDLAGAAEASTSRLENPNRLIIELRRPGAAAEAQIAQTKPVIQRQFNPPPPTRAALSPKRAPETVLLPPPVVETPAAPVTASIRSKLSNYPRPAPPPPNPNSPPALVAASPSTPPHARDPETPSATLALAKPSIPPINAPLPPPATAASLDLPSQNVVPARRPSAAARSAETALPAKRNASGDRSMIRVLGLKVGRIVLDAGHGGHDTGTVGPEGLREKDLVLDVAMKLGAMIEERMGSEVIYTRSDDTFIPLERRTEIANEAKADLFLSIHANSSNIRTAAGVETYYLNFTTSKAALDVAARENSASEETVYDLQDLLQKIALKDKVEESRDFASRIQTSLFALSAKSNVSSKDRGVRKAPFVVLIGASMPSVLAEVGFLSNPHDENSMKRQDYRQRIAEALYKGLSSYAATLSHFQVAQRH